MLFRSPLLLTDFWFADITAAILEEGQMGQALSVSLAPEQLASGAAVAASDQYALAVLAYELLLGHRLSRVNLSLKLYETFVRQGAGEVSESELERARNIDLVLARALAENPAARFHNIEEFALTFRAIARGESIDLATDETVKLPILQHTTEIVAAVAGALVAEAALEDTSAVQENVTASDDSTAELLAAAQLDEKAHPEHGHSLHKTVLTSEGMEAVELEQGATTMEEVTRSPTNSSSTLAAEEAAGAAGFVAGLTAGEILGEATVLAQESQLASASAAEIGRAHV